MAPTERCMSCGMDIQPCICITKYGERPDIHPIPSTEELSKPGRWFEENGIYPVCGTRGPLWDDGAYPPETDTVRK